MQADLETAQDTVKTILQAVASDPQTQADAAKGIIRGPQLAVVELQLRKLKLSQAAASIPVTNTRTEQQPGAGSEQQHGAGSSSLPESHCTDSTQAVAEAVLSYYKQLGHMLSCAADLRQVPAQYHVCI